MSWIKKELRKRERLETRAAGQEPGPQDSDPVGEAAALTATKAQALWDRIEATHAALPEPLQLKREVPESHEFPSERAAMLVLLSARNGACIGYTGDAVRYLWPKKNVSQSNNFWIRWRVGKGYVVSRRTRPSLLRSSAEEQAFRDSAVDHILRCLVTERQVKFRSVRKRRFWLF
jgi:hypothetical protein